MARGARAQARRGPHRGARRGDKLTRGPASPKRRGAGGTGVPSLTDSALSPRAPHGARPRRWPEKGVGAAGNGERHCRLGLRHLEDDLERSRGTTEGQATRALARRGGAAPLPGAGWGPLAGHSPEARRSVRCVGRPRSRQPRVRSRRGRRAKSGRDPHPGPSTHRRRAGRRGEGPADRTRRAVPLTRNVRPSSGAA